MGDIQMTQEQIQQLLQTVASVPDLHTQLQGLTAQLQESIQRTEQQQIQIQQLSQTNASNAEVKPSAYRVQPPENFEGTRKELPKFFTQLELVFRSGPAQFS